MQTTSYIQRRLSAWRDLPIDLISRSPIARWAPIPLRLIVGYGFMEHGFAKLARGPDAFPAILQALGVPAPHFMGWLTIPVEIFGGLAVLLGALVPLASIPMAAVSWSPSSPCICPTDSARSSSRRSPMPARSLGRRALKPISLPRVPCDPRLGRLRTAGDRGLLAKRREARSGPAGPTANGSSRTSP